MGWFPKTWREFVKGVQNVPEAIGKAAQDTAETIGDAPQVTIDFYSDPNNVRVLRDFAKDLLGEARSIFDKDEPSASPGGQKLKDSYNNGTETKTKEVEDHLRGKGKQPSSQPTNFPKQPDNFTNDEGDKITWKLPYIPIIHPKPRLAQTPTQTPINRPIPISQSIFERQWGKLAFFPVTSATFVIPNIVPYWGDIDRNNASEEAQSDIANNLVRNLNEQANDHIDQDVNEWEIAALAFPAKMRGLSGNWGYAYGIKHLLMLDLGYSDRNLATYCAPRSTASANYTEFNFRSDPKGTFPNHSVNLKKGDSKDRIGAFPKKLPRLLTDDHTAGYDPEKDTIEIRNLADLVVWQTWQLDALMGQFPIKIKITDTDLIEEGEQSKDINLPNLAETVREIVGLNINQSSMINALIEISLRLLTEGAADRKTGLTNFYRLRAIADYLGYKTKQETIEVDFAFNPAVGAEKKGVALSEALKPSTIKMIMEDNDDDRTHEQIADILIEAARIIKGVFFHKWRGADIEKNFLKDQLAEMEKTGEDFDLWLDSIEQGFTSEATTRDPSRPYGKPYSQRPKIRNIGNKQGEGDGG